MTDTKAFKRGDTSPSLGAKLTTDSVGTPADLSNASEVRFLMKHHTSGETVVNAPATIVSPYDGKVQYQWEDGDTDRTGLHYIEWEVRWAGDVVETYPADGYLQLYISEDIN